MQEAEEWANVIFEEEQAENLKGGRNNGMN